MRPAVILASLLIVCFASPGATWNMGPGRGSHAPAFTLQDSNTAATAKEIPSDEWEYIAGPFTAGSTYTCTKVDVFLAKSGTPSGNYTVEIRADSSGSPGSVVGTGSASIAGSTFPSSEDWVSFTGISASLSSGVTYWVTVKSTALESTGNEALVKFSDGGSNNDKVSHDASAWLVFWGNALIKFRAYSS